VIRNRWVGVGVLLAAVAGLTTVQQLLPRPAKTLWWHVVYDAGHVPLFGLFSLAALGLTLSLVRRPREHHFRHYVFAFGVTVVAGSLIELLQWGAPPRTATLLDLGRNVAGSAAFLALAATFDPLMARGSSRPKKTALRVTSGLLIAVSLIPVGLTGAAVVRRNAVFPRLTEFGTWLGRYLVDARNVELEAAPLPEPWAPEAGPLGARVTFLPGRPSILALRAPYPDWSGYQRLEFTVYSGLDRPVELSLRIQDQERLPALGDVFLEILTIEPGENRILIPLSRVRALASGREMNMTHVHRIVFKAVEVWQPFSVWLEDLHLE
jgi:hypothetical protein